MTMLNLARARARTHLRRRRLLSACLSVLGVLLIALPAACGGQTSSASGDGGGVPQTNGHTMGSACTPRLEDNAAFSSFREDEVNIESVPGESSGSAVCLVNHFRGRVTCTYGQDQNGAGPFGGPSCKTPSGAAVTGNPRAPQGAAVDPQCLDRRAAKTVHWSCRCANALDRTDDGDTYCTCPSSMTCAPLVTSIGEASDHLSGSYCIQAGAEYDRNTVCSGSCDFAAQDCP
jgi:hypothetical protein